MRKNFCVAVVILAMLCALVVTGCKDEPEDTVHTNPAFLEGIWNSDNPGVNSFKIEADLSFDCSVEFPVLGTTTVTGRLDYSGSALGPNDYVLQDMSSTNPYAVGAVEDYNDVPVTLTPNGDRTKFVFTSIDDEAAAFFGGTYTKLEL